MKIPKISIIIPVKNGILTIRQCLNSIFNQTLICQSEVIIIDSGSSDGTIELLKEYPIRLFQIPPQDFNHGATRNYGVSLAKGEFVVMTVQDARPGDNRWLEKMLNHFSDTNVAAVVGQQVVPHDPDKNPHQWWRPVSKPGYIEIYYDNPSDFLRLSGQAKDDACHYDDVNTMYRKSALQEIPFQEVDFGEDMLIVIDLLSNRKKVIYDTNSSVWHYHFQSKDYAFRSTITVLYYKYKIFGYVPQYNYSFIDVLLIIYRNFKYRAALKWIYHNVQIKIQQRKAYKFFMFEKEKGIESLENFYKKVNPTVVQGRQ
jgi:rhamnosyltransferase